MIVAQQPMVYANAYAQSDPHIEPGPIQTFSRDAAIVSGVLLNKQLATCISKVQKSVYDVTFHGGVTFQHLFPNVTRYVFSGMALTGDIVVGPVTLEILETRRGRPDLNWKDYSCTVSLPKNDP